MRFNYKNTALGFLDNPDSIDFYMPEYKEKQVITPDYEKTFRDGLVEVFQKAKEDGNCFKDRIQFISRPFALAFEKAKHKLVDIFDKEHLDESGTLMYSSGSFTTTIFYSVVTKGTGEDWTFDMIFILFTKHTDADKKGLDVFLKIDSNEEGIETRSLIWEDFVNQGYDRTHWSSWLICFLLFTKHCEIETKTVERKKKLKHLGEKWLNETNQNVEILDSTWFTTIIRSKGFWVGKETAGFFRKQYYGPGKSEWKMKWIKPFEKEGYRKQAKVITRQ